MPDINREIILLLKKYPNEIQELAKESLRAADTMPPQSATEHVANVVRKIVKERGGKK